MDERRVEDYEGSEEIAIAAGKEALARAPWLFNRAMPEAKGFFVELRENPASRNLAEVHCVDGNGTKLFLSPWSGNYRLAPIDGLAMNANDMATIINAYPNVLNIYMACQTGFEEEHMGEVMHGFVDGLERIRIPNAPWDLNIGKMETASLDEMISLGIAGKGVDFGVVMSGLIHRTRIPALNPQPGNIIVGVSSSGMHSNGFTGARHVLLAPDPALEPRDEWRSKYRGRFSLTDTPSELEGKTVLDALQVPTALYLVEASLVGERFDTIDIYGVNITGNGLHNFNRVGEGVSFEITDPLDLLPIHRLLAQESGWDAKTAYTKQNMGMGFAYIVPDLETAEFVVNMINERGENHAQVVGEVSASDLSELRTTLHQPYEGPKLDFIGYG